MAWAPQQKPRTSAELWGWHSHVTVPAQLPLLGLLQAARTHLAHLSCHGSVLGQGIFPGLGSPSQLFCHLFTTLSVPWDQQLSSMLQQTTFNLKQPLAFSTSQKHGFQRSKPQDISHKQRNLHRTFQAYGARYEHDYCLRPLCLISLRLLATLKMLLTCS